MLNLLAFATWTESTGDEAYRTVFIVNAVMHGIWGIHNLQITVRKFSGTDDGTLAVPRRAWPLMSMHVHILNQFVFVDVL